MRFFSPWLAIGLVYLSALGGLGGLAWLAVDSELRSLPLERRSPSFPTVEGTIVASSVEWLGDGRAKHQHAHVVTEYVVSGRRYRTSRVHFGSRSVAFSFEASRTTVERYPEGERVVVYYDPDAPHVAALEPGVVGAGLATLAQLTPLWLMLLWLLALPIAALRARHDTHDILRVDDSVDAKRYRLHSVHWFTMGFAGSMLGTLLITCCGGFAVPFTGTGIGIALVAWALELTLVVGAMLWGVRALRTGRWDIVLDRRKRALVFPPGTMLGPRREVRLRDLDGFSLERDGRDSQVKLVVHEQDASAFVALRSMDRCTGERLVEALHEDLSAAVDRGATRR